MPATSRPGGRTSEVAVGLLVLTATSKILLAVGRTSYTAVGKGRTRPKQGNVRLPS